MNIAQFIGGGGAVMAMISMIAMMDAIFSSSNSKTIDEYSSYLDRQNEVAKQGEVFKD